MHKRVKRIRQGFMSALTERIQQRRKQLRMSQIELAEALDMSQTQVSRYELGQNSPTAEVLIKIANVMNVRVEWLLGLTNGMTVPAETDTDLTTLEQQTVEALRLSEPDKRQALVDIFRQIAALVSP